MSGEVCANCGEPVKQLKGYCSHWVHEHGLVRCQSNVDRYGPEASPIAAPVDTQP